MPESVQETTSDDWDRSFVFPLDLNRLQTPRITLTLFKPENHLASLIDSFSTPTKYLPFDLTRESFLPWAEARYARNPSNKLFAIIDKATGQFAGVIGILDTTLQHLSTEIGPIVVVPAFRRTHISTHAVGAILAFCLNMPFHGGIGLRRVQWRSHPLNLASLKLADRMGFVLEGVVRWNYVLPEGRDGDEGLEPSKDDPVRRKGRHSKVLSICWDDWEDGVKERVKTLVESS